MGLPKCPFNTRGYELAKQKAYCKYQNYDCTKDEVDEYVYRYIEEEMRKVNQARLADMLDRVTVRRLLKEVQQGQPKTTDSSEKMTADNSDDVSVDSSDNKKIKLTMDKKSKVIELSGLMIFPKVGGQDEEAIVGTLQSHVNGFIYATSSGDFKVTFLYKDVKKLFFFLAEDGKEMPPLLHFHLGSPTKVGTEKRENIQFRLVPAHVGLKRSDDDSVKIEKEKETADNWGRNKGLKNFVVEVQKKWMRQSESHYPFAELNKTDEFYGVGPSKTRFVFHLTLSSLVGLADTPPLMVELLDIEIVNLAKVQPNEICMTVVYKDLKLDPLQISSIPGDSLDRIKDRLDFGNVKYYVNHHKPDYLGSMLAERTEYPKRFIERGGWKSYNLEDRDTLCYYDCSKGSDVVVNDSDVVVSDSDEEV